MFLKAEDVQFKHSRGNTGIYSKLKSTITDMNSGDAFLFANDQYGSSIKYVKPQAYQVARALGKRVSVRQHIDGIVVVVI
jgi:hypothetical protein